MILLYDYRDLFINMAVHNNRSKISNSQSATRIMKFVAVVLTNDVFTPVHENYRSAF